MNQSSSNDGEGWLIIIIFVVSLLFFLNGDMTPTGADCPGGYWQAGMRFVDVATWVCP